MALTSLLLLSALLPFRVHSYAVGIVNGSEAIPHSRPYMVSVQKDGEHICGGFLVSKYFVMTAAHCWTYGENLTVVLGAHDLSMTNCCSTKMDVKFYHIHPGYHYVDYDIMLLQLNGSVEWGPSIGWINLVRKNEDVKPHTTCSVAGWGKTITHGHPSNRLREVNVVVLHETVCQASWKAIFSASRMMCVGGKGGICKRDGGGPLVCNNTAVGIVSFYEKFSCYHPRAPNVYTKISSLRSWITPIINSLK